MDAMSALPPIVLQNSKFSKAVFLVEIDRT